MDLICRWQRYANNIIYQKIWLMQLSELQLKNRRGLWKHHHLNKLTPVFHASVLLVIKNFVIPLSKRGSADNFENAMKKLIVNNRPDAWKIDVSLFFHKNYQLFRSRSLHHEFMSLSAYWQWKLANKRARSSVVTVKTVLDY